MNPDAWDYGQRLATGNWLIIIANADTIFEPFKICCD